MVVEWRRYVKDGRLCTVCADTGETCARCSETGPAVRDAIHRLRGSFEERGVRLRYIETAVIEQRVRESNSVLFDGRPLEDVVGAEVVRADCASCSGQVCATTCCRALRMNGRTYETVPPELIEVALHRAAGL